MKKIAHEKKITPERCPHCHQNGHPLPHKAPRWNSDYLYLETGKIRAFATPEKMHKQIPLPLTVLSVISAGLLLAMISMSQGVYFKNHPKWMIVGIIINGIMICLTTFKILDALSDQSRIDAYNNIILPDLQARYRALQMCLKCKIIYDKKLEKAPLNSAGLYYMMNIESKKIASKIRKPRKLFDQ